MMIKLWQLRYENKMKCYLYKEARQITLESPSRKGGEASIYHIGDTIFKIYNKPEEYKDKLENIINFKIESPIPNCAWPQDLIYKDSKFKKFLGFTMKHIPGQQIHELYVTQSRKKHFPDTDFRFILNVAINLCEGLASLHKRNILALDISGKNFLVDESANVYFIDCDSYQIEYNNRLYTSRVLTTGFIPPELKGSDDKQRTVQHENFSLAILLFYLIFFKHPYAGKDNVEGSEQTAIYAGRFAWGKIAKGNSIAECAAGLKYDEIPGYLQEMFDKVFGASSAERPSASEWAESLKRFKDDLTVCINSSMHDYYKKLNSCPWCECKLENNNRAGNHFPENKNLDYFYSIYCIIRDIQDKKRRITNPDIVALLSSQDPISEILKYNLKLYLKAIAPYKITTNSEVKKTFKDLYQIYFKDTKKFMDLSIPVHEKTKILKELDETVVSFFKDPVASINRLKQKKADFQDLFDILNCCPQDPFSQFKKIFFNNLSRFGNRFLKTRRT